jgi:hypothetical protein
MSDQKFINQKVREFLAQESGGMADLPWFQEEIHRRCNRKILPTCSFIQRDYLLPEQEKPSIYAALEQRYSECATLRQIVNDAYQQMRSQNYRLVHDAHNFEEDWLTTQRNSCRKISYLLKTK